MLLINKSISPASAVELKSATSVCFPSGFVSATMCTTLWVQDYIVHHGPALCTTDLRCTPWCTRGTYVWEVGVATQHFFGGWQWTCKSRFTVQFCTDIHFGSAQCSFLPIRWWTRRFCMFVINIFWWCLMQCCQSQCWWVLHLNCFTYWHKVWGGMHLDSMEVISEYVPYYRVRLVFPSSMPSWHSYVRRGGSITWHGTLWHVSWHEVISGSAGRKAWR